MYPFNRRLNFNPYEQQPIPPGIQPSDNIPMPNFMPPEQQQPVAPQPVAPQQQPNIPPQQQPLGVADRLAMLYDQSNNGPASQAYGRYLDSAPSRQNYKPTLATSLSSALEGFSAGVRGQNGAKEGQEILDKPFQDQENDYLKRGPGLARGADLENKSAQEKIALIKQQDAEEKEGAKESRQALLDKSTLDKNQAEIANYKSLSDARKNQGLHYFENETTGELQSYNPNNGQTVSLGKTKLTPEEKSNLEVKTYTDKESAVSPIIASREKGVHESNRNFDALNPVSSRVTAPSFVSPSQQKVAESQAAKQLNIESGGKYSDFINDDGTVKNPSDLGGMFSKGDSEGLKTFYALVKAKAKEIGNVSREPVRGNPALSGPPVNVPPVVDSRISGR